MTEGWLGALRRSRLTLVAWIVGALLTLWILWGPFLDVA